MGAEGTSGLFQIGADVMATEVSEKTGAILARTGDVQNDTNESDNVEWWQHVGLKTRPTAPTAGQEACQMVTIRQSDHDACIASKDLRNYTVEDVGDGETLLYAQGSDARVFLKNDGTIRIKSSGGTILITPNGAITIENPTGDKLSLASATADLIGTAQANVNAPLVGLGAVPLGGVATSVTLLPLLTLLIAQNAALTLWLNDPSLTGTFAPSAATLAPLLTAITATSVAAALPTNFSLTVTAAS